MEDLYYNDITDEQFYSIVNRREQEAEELTNKLGLKEVREKNVRMYLSTYLEEQMLDERYQDFFNDSRQFTSVRTILPFLTARVTAPEVVPSDDKDLNLQFAKDFEDGLLRHAEEQQAKAKIRLAIQDLLKGERIGILKWRYDAYLEDTVVEHVKPSSVLIGKRARYLEEPDYVQFKLEKTVEDLINMLPGKEAYIKEVFNIDKAVQSQMERVHEIKEEWVWIQRKGERKLVMGLRWNQKVLGKTLDPNWNEKGKNVNKHPMIPAVFFNFLPGGDTHYDETSYMEQSKWLQVNYNRLGQTIMDNAKYGGTGVPIFATGSIPQKDVAKIRFSPIQRVLLKTDDVRKSFTTWQATPLPAFIAEDKYDSRNSIDNIWGTPNIFRGEQSDNNTLGQDVLVRDQAEGRLADPVDQIDVGMQRFYDLEAQLAYRYWDEDKYITYIGGDGKFVKLVISQEKIAENAGIKVFVKAGSSLPIDKAQKRQTVVKLAEMNRISTLVLYRELGIFEDPEEAYKQFVLESVDPAASLQEVDRQKFSREAAEDIYMVMGDKEPEEREDIQEDYIQYLTDWLNTDKFALLQVEDAEAAARISVFADSIIAKAARKVNKLAMQQPEQEPQQEVDPETGELLAPVAPPAPVEPIA